MRMMLTLTALCTLAACEGPATGEAPDVAGADEPAAAVEGSGASTAPVPAGHYAAAVANPARSEADRERDAARKPAEVLEFFGIAPGMRVLDLFSGGGYYTELLSYVVGPAGVVTAHNNSAYLGYAGDEIAARYADDRLPNVHQLLAENNELALESAAYDAVTMILAYHDVYYVDPDNGWPAIDARQLLAEVHGALKPGGIVGVVDHAAPAGAPATTGGTTHRIDRALLIRDFEAAGFELADSSDILQNPDDDREVAVFDPAVRGKTSRFALLFRK